MYSPGWGNSHANLTHGHHQVFNEVVSTMYMKYFESTKDKKFLTKQITFNIFSAVEPYVTYDM